MIYDSRFFWVLTIILLPLLVGCESRHDNVYDDFMQRLEADEAYIGFFATEKVCISNINNEYLNARRDFFLGVDTCKEDPEQFIEPFIEFCQTNNLIKDGYEKEWEKILFILSYELYVNMPIFNYAAENIIAHRNLVFARYPKKKLQLDLFLPEQPFDQPVPCIVCIHGGGWRVNRRVWFEPFAQYLASKGFAAVTIDYRMLPAVRIIDCVFDTKAAVRWVRANAEQYNIDPGRIGAIGASAGAHLVALLGTTAEVHELEGNGGNQNVSSAVQAVVGIATPAFTLSTSAQRAERFGLSLEDLRLLSPYENITKSAAPLYLIHGTADKTVPAQNSQEMYDRYQEVGAYVELTWIPGEDHGFYEGNDRAISMATDFFKKIFIEE